MGTSQPCKVYRQKKKKVAAFAKEFYKLKNLRTVLCFAIFRDHLETDNTENGCHINGICCKESSPRPSVQRLHIWPDEKADFDFAFGCTWAIACYEEELINKTMQVREMEISFHDKRIHIMGITCFLLRSYRLLPV